MRRLIQVTDISDFIRDNKALCDLYNSKGGLYAVKGTVLPAARQRIELYVRSADYALYSSAPEEKERPRIETPVQIEKPDFTTVIETFVPHETVELYRNIMSDLSSVFEENMPVPHIIDFAEDIITKTFNENKIDLYLCNKAFASYNKTTARHSFSVYLLFCEVMFDFRKQTRDLPFYTEILQKTAV